MNEYIWRTVRTLLDEAWNAFNCANTWTMERNTDKAQGVLEFMKKNYKNPKAEEHIRTVDAEIDRLWTKRNNCFSW